MSNIGRLLQTISVNCYGHVRTPWFCHESWWLMWRLHFERTVQSTWFTNSNARRTSKPKLGGSVLRSSWICFPEVVLEELYWGWLPHLSLPTRPTQLLWFAEGVSNMLVAPSASLPSPKCQLREMSPWTLPGEGEKRGLAWISNSICLCLPLVCSVCHNLGSCWLWPHGIHLLSCHMRWAAPGYSWRGQSLHIV